MAMPQTQYDPAALIDGRYAVDPARPLPGAGAGLPAFAAHDRQGGAARLMAVQVAADAPPRADALMALAGLAAPDVLVPLAHGPGRGPSGEPAWFVISPAPPGPALSAALRPWGEAELLSCVLRPVADALAALHARGVTHRAVRPDNLFRAGPGEPAVLGAAWAAPPASLQPCLFEPPGSAMCLPAGRGDGSAADDIYALGVTLLVLALGRRPLEGLDDTAILRRKLAMGSFAALAGEQRLPASVADLVRSMLAEDPEHRPPPALLADPAAARSRRVAARPPRRAQHAMEFGTDAVWDARSLALSLAVEPDQGARQLRGGLVDRWLRRHLGDPGLAARVDEVVRLRAADGAAEDKRADALMTLRAVAVLDPLAPLCWQGVALWPDGLGPALAFACSPAASASGLAGALSDLVATEAAASWAAMRPDRCDAAALRTDARKWRMLVRLPGWVGGLARLRYALNPLLPCRSGRLAAGLVARLPDLVPALEAAAAAPGARNEMPLDREIVAFIAARDDQGLEPDLIGLADGTAPEAAATLQLRVLARLQDAGPVPALASRLAEFAAPALGVLRNRARREAAQQALAKLARGGQLAPLLGLVASPALRAADAREALIADEAVRRIDAELASIAAGADGRADAARRIGQEVALGVGMMALTVSLVALVLA